MARSLGVCAYFFLMILGIKAQDRNALDKHTPEAATPNTEKMLAEETTPSPPGTAGRLDILGPYNASACAESLCILKCCPENEMLDFPECVPASMEAKKWDLDAYEKEDGLPEGFVLMVGLPILLKECLFHDKDDIVIQEDGSLYARSRRGASMPSYYCLDDIKEDDVDPFHRALVCQVIPLKEKSEVSKIASYIIVTFQVFSVVCLGMVILLHIPVLKNHHLQDSSFLCFCLSYLAAFVLSLLIITPGIPQSLSPASCTFVGFAEQYVLLSLQAWLAIRCYDIYRILVGSSNAIPLSNLVRSKTRFVKYCLISYGGPLIITFFTLLFQFLPGDLGSFPRPNIGSHSCWIQDNLAALFIYYLTYQFALHTLSLVFMSLSASVLYKSGVAFQCCGKLTNRQDGLDLNAFNKPCLEMFREQFYLFLATVVIISLDSISFIDIHSNYWKIVDILNSLQGFFILVIVVRSPPRRKILVDGMKRISKSQSKSKTEQITGEMEDLVSNQLELGHPICTTDPKRRTATQSKRNF